MTMTCFLSEVSSTSGHRHYSC